MPFWFFIKRSKTGKHYKRLLKNRTVGISDEEKLSRLKKLLVFSVENVPYYSRLFAELNIKLEDIDSLSAYSSIVPVLTKDDVRRHFKDLIPRKKVPKKIGVTQTSGSTGKSTKFLVDFNAGQRWLAVKIFHRSLHGIYPGDKTLWIWGRNRQRPSKFRQWIGEKIKNEYYFSAFNISEESALEMSAVIQKKGITVIYGYSSAIDEYARIFDKLEMRFSLNKVFVTAEKLYPDQKSRIEKIFGCRTVNEYGAAEMGIIGIECSHGNLHIVEENVYCEVVGNDI